MLMPAARYLGPTIGLVDRPGSLKIHQEPISVLGGAAVILSTLVAWGIVRGELQAGQMAGVGLALAIGIADDARQLPPWVRAVFLGVAGFVIGISLFGPVELGTVGVITLVLACSNAVNLIDGQDGLAGGLAAIAALVLAILLARNGGLDTGLGFALCGSLLGFLFWNRPPARIFLGNGGAYGVGACLAFLAAENVMQAGWRGLLATGVCLSVFAWELLFTVGRRLRSGQPLTGGDRSHTYDLAAKRLGSRAKSTIVFWGFGAVAGTLSVVVDTLPLTVGLAIVSVVTGILAALAFLFGRRMRSSVST